MSRTSTIPSAASGGAAVEKLVLEHIPLAHSVALRFRDRGIDVDDLVQVAYEALIKAASRFDPQRGVGFGAFAVPTIRGELRKHFRDDGWLVRPPRRIQERQWAVNRAVERIRAERGREPTRAEVVEDVGIDEDEYHECMAASGCFHGVSLDQPVEGDGEGALLEVIKGEDGTDAGEARAVLAPVVRRLSSRDRRILFLRFFEDRTQREIGQDLGITQMQVSRLLNRILTQLRDEIDDVADPEVAASATEHGARSEPQGAGADELGVA
ncbi:RNA polymerase sigma-B factor [Mumia flava]|uniref:RNA polymerase sigma-B factor n=1 Tax=Mumia flava TaxID=1348852 RepID=A0A2M9BDY4_9ACTN|nr:sigma-70 family RNA polymerase sigma factor [Mumia flava]PJJ56142.1 RNA polymerase sigma-B factor [Mumia flava]